MRKQSSSVLLRKIDSLRTNLSTSKKGKEALSYAEKWIHLVQARFRQSTPKQLRPYLSSITQEIELLKKNYGKPGFGKFALKRLMGRLEKSSRTELSSQRKKTIQRKNKTRERTAEPVSN